MDLRRFPLVLILAALASDRTWAQGKLDQAHDRVQGGHRNQDEDPTDNDEWLEDDDTLDSLFGNAVDVALEYTVLLPFVLPRAALEDEHLEPGRFQEYPYAVGPGFWLAPEGLDRWRDFSARISVEGGSECDDLERYGLGLRLEHVSRFGLDATWNRWREDLAGGGTGSSTSAT
jgi:hypothetical protein